MAYNYRIRPLKVDFYTKAYLFERRPKGWKYLFKTWEVLRVSHTPTEAICNMSKVLSEDLSKDS